MKANGKNIRISPKKLRVIAEIIRWQKATEALDFLKFAPKKWADILYKILFTKIPQFSSIYPFHKINYF